MVASTPGSVEAKLNEWQGRINSLPEEDRPQAQSLLATALQQLGMTEQSAQKTAQEMQEAKQNSTDEAAVNEAEQADNQTETAEQTLANLLHQLFELFGQEEGKHGSTVPVAVGDAVRRKDDTWSNGVVKSIQELEVLGQKQKRVFILLKKAKGRKGEHGSQPGTVSVTVEQLTKDFATSPDSLGIGGFAKGHSEGIPEHSEYEPKNRIETKIKGGSTHIQYETVGGAKFEALISADQMIHKISGTKLRLKRDLGIEGRGIIQDSPGFIANANLNRSHLIADLFLGSGYKSAANLVSASATYNNIKMGEVEDQIVRLITVNKAREFNLSVTAKLGELNKADIVQQILSIVPAEERDTVKASVEQFASQHPTFKAILEVNYQVTLTNAETDEVISIDFNLGSDQYLRV